MHPPAVVSHRAATDLRVHVRERAFAETNRDFLKTKVISKTKVSDSSIGTVQERVHQSGGHAAHMQRKTVGCRLLLSSLRTCESNAGRRACVVDCRESNRERGRPPPAARREFCHSAAPYPPLQQVIQPGSRGDVSKMTALPTVNGCSPPSAVMSAFHLASTSGCPSKTPGPASSPQWFSTCPHGPRGGRVSLQLQQGLSIGIAHRLLADSCTRDCPLGLQL